MNSTVLPASVDVVVVGAGVIGLSSALELSRRGFKICVLERDAMGRPCSWAGGGMLSPLPPDAPVPDIAPLLDRSLALYPEYCAQLLEETGIDPEYWRCGARWITATGTQTLPMLAQVRNPRLMAALRAALQRRGVPVLAPVTVGGWRRQGTKLVGVETDAGTITCGRAVLAAGAWSGPLSGLPMRPVKGQMLLFKAPPGQLEHIRMGESAYLIPRRDGHLLLGSTVEDAGFDTTPTTAAKALLLEQGHRLWRALEGLPVLDHWAGLRPHGGQAAPFIEAVTGLSGLYCNTGHFRLGLTLAPASALRLADLVQAGG